MQLRALLAATHYAFDMQIVQRDRLYNLLLIRIPTTVLRTEPKGYEELFSTHSTTFTPEEAELHEIIRGLTVYGLGPNNRSMIKWLTEDIDFRTQRSAEGQRGELAAELNRLSNHLLSWRAKYEMWIPHHQDHALVYLEDEKRHGVGFPHGIEGLVDKILAEI